MSQPALVENTSDPICSYVLRSPKLCQNPGLTGGGLRLEAPRRLYTMPS